MLLIPALLGSLILLAASLIAWRARRRASYIRCPECGASTLALQTPRWIQAVTRRVQQRWCGGCGWKGFGRLGPRLDRARGPVSHDSGFRWQNGIQAAEKDPSGFRWGATEVAGQPHRPDHASGFTWAGNPSPAADESFAWGDQEELREGKPAFAWREPRSTSQPPAGFNWAGESTVRPEPQRPGGFSWKNPS